MVSVENSKKGNSKVKSIIQQFKVESQTSAAEYTVSRCSDDSWQCSCIGWTRHVPRRDCKHILWVKTYGPVPIEPLLMAAEKAQRKAERKGLVTV